MDLVSVAPKVESWRSKSGCVHRRRLSKKAGTERPASCDSRARCFEVTIKFEKRGFKKYFPRWRTWLLNNQGDPQKEAPSGVGPS